MVRRGRQAGAAMALVLLLTGALIGCGSGSDGSDGSDGGTVTIEPEPAETADRAAFDVWYNAAGPKVPYLRAAVTDDCFDAMGPESKLEAVADRMEELRTGPKAKPKLDRSAAEADESGEAMVSVTIERVDIDAMKAAVEDGKTDVDPETFALEPLQIPAMRYVKTDDGWKLDDERCGSLEELLVGP